MLLHVTQQLEFLAVDLFRLCVWLVLLAVIFAPLEYFFGSPPRAFFRAGQLRDLGYYFLNNYIPRLLQFPPLIFIGWLFHFVVPHQVYAFVSSLTLWERLIAALVLGDIGYYWGHRFMHQVPFLWRFHQVHHGAERIDWLVNTRSHPLDITFGHICGLVPLYALSLSQHSGDQVDTLVQLYIVIGLAWGFFIHANLRWRFGWLEYLVSTPAFHHWHHTKRDHVDRNYAAMLPWLDMIFGSFYLPKLLPAEYGVKGEMPPDLTGQLLLPFEAR